MFSHYYKALVATLLLTAGHAYAELDITNAWVRAVPPVSKTTAAYFTLTNSSSAAVTLTGACATFAESAELHDMSMQDGRRSMRHIDALPLAPGESVTFGSGGLHVMLFGLTRVPAQGETVNLCLHFASGNNQCADFEVRQQ